MSDTEHDCPESLRLFATRHYCERKNRHEKHRAVVEAEAATWEMRKAYGRPAYAVHSNRRIIAATVEWTT